MPPVGIKLGLAGDRFGYAIDFGLPGYDPSGKRQTAFLLDPKIKEESIWHGPQLRPSTLLTDRSGSAIRVRDADGAWTTLDHRLRPYDSMLSELGASLQAPEVMSVREQLRSWRFYDHFRTDAAAPSRQGRVGTRTPVLGADGADLAAALQTIVESGRGQALDEVIDRAFPGNQLRIEYPGSDPSLEDRTGVFTIALSQPGLLRPLVASDLSDGTLRYLLLVAGLLSPRPPALFVLNEPEARLHPQLLEPLAELMQRASQDAQIMVVTHAEALVAHLERVGEADGSVPTLELLKEDGETRVAGQRSLDQPSWKWPTR